MVFRIGQKVVCIRDDWRIHLSGFARIKAFFRRQDADPVKGQIYRIREIVIMNGEPWLRFMELRNQEQLGFIEPLYLGRRFRPLISQETNISIFQAMLKSVKEDA